MNETSVLDIIIFGGYRLQLEIDETNYSKTGVFLGINIMSLQSSTKAIIDGLLII